MEAYKNRYDSPADESELIAGCVKRNRIAQKQLYDKYATKMMGVCVRYADNYDAARDLLHDGFIQLFKKIDAYKGEGSFEGWMRKLFVNMALGYLRKKDVLKAHDGYATDIPAADYSVFEKLSADELVAKIATLPAGFRMVFNLYAVEGYSHQEIAGLLHITESASRSQYMRARSWLQKMILESEKVNK
ncbi:MAG: sigma-70 family RNA polymerase sigma factor [Prevotellaceae bacterium]|jgi:RNA polymerase sigma-70 factor (ECF subfamily)|nr:sigma-70 family RNA polymerase sigma factor [Prevotellaceae bacterium]